MEAKTVTPVTQELLGVEAKTVTPVAVQELLLGVHPERKDGNSGYSGASGSGGKDGNSGYSGASGSGGKDGNSGCSGAAAS